MLKPRTIAIQDRYGERFQHCQGMWSKNDLGLRLYPSVDGSSCISRIKAECLYWWSSFKCLGGMIATCTIAMVASAAWFAHHQKGLERRNQLIGRFITARLEIDYTQSSPIEDGVVTSTLEELGEESNCAMEMTVILKSVPKPEMVAVLKDHM